MAQIVQTKGVIITPLKIIEHPKGEIYHIIKDIDPGYIGFGEVYISTINYGDTKAWKKHIKMTCNFVVPIGKIKMVIIDLKKGNKQQYHIEEFILSPNEYYRLTIPPGLWYGFKGLAKGKNMLINFADIRHDPCEQINSDYTTNSEITYKW